MFACVHKTGSRDGCLGDLIVLARSFTPLIEETSTDTVVLDIAGCENLFGSPRAIAQELASRASRSEIKTSIAVAGNPDAAVCAAVGLPGVNVIPEGKEAAALRSLPVGLLRVTAMMPIREKVTGGIEARDDDAARRLDEILATLDLWGIRTFGELARLPEAGLSERLGPLGVRLRKLARGACDRPLLIESSELAFQRSIELDDPIELLEPLSFVFSGLLEALCMDLKSRALAAGEIKLRMRLEDRSLYERVICLPLPMRSSKVFSRLLAHEIELHPPQTAIVAVSIAAAAVCPRSLQNGLFQPLAPEPEKLELTLVRLMKLVGPENVGSPEILDTHRPDGFRMRRFGLKDNRKRRKRSEVRGQRSEIRGQRSEIRDQRSEIRDQRSEIRGQGSEVRGRRLAAAIQNPESRIQNQQAPIRNPQSAIRNPKCSLGFRVFRPPLSAEVEYQSGRPALIRAQSTAQSRIIRGRVAQAAGPWRTCGDWWRPDQWARDEWDVSVAETGALYRIYKDLCGGGWFVEGVYD